MPIPSLLLCVPVLVPAPQTYSCTELFGRALQGQLGPEGGVLAGSTLPRGATLGAGGRTALISQIVGVPRNQAVMVSDGVSLRAIAVGCGGTGGSGAPGACGDPTPIGGTFAGFFLDAWYAPVGNAAGDVLFLADVFGGSAPRALFLYRAATDAIESVAAVGDLSPSGQTITALGQGRVDEEGDVIFLARTQPGSGGANEILARDAGVLSVVAREGGLGPDGPYDGVAGEFQLFPDGTSVAAGKVPARDALGRVAHWGATSITQLFGIVLQSPGQAPAWLATFGQPTPAGGHFTSFGAPLFASNGEVVFSAQFQVGSTARTGWFAGGPGSLRCVLATQDSIGSSTCTGTERSRGPFQPAGRGGEVVLWARIQRPDLSLGEVLVVVRAGGSLEVVAETGQPSVTGHITELGRFPSIDESGRVLVSALLQPGASTEAVWITAPCGLPVAYCEGKPSSLGCVPRIDSHGRGLANGSVPFVVSADSLPSHRPGLLLYGHSIAATPFQGGTLCIGAPLRRTPVQTSSGPSPSDCSGTLAFDFAGWIASGVDPALQFGTTVAAQWLVRDPADPLGFGSTLSDALLLTIGP